MSKVTLQRICSALLRNYSDTIDMSDCNFDNKKDHERCLLSRALAADFIRSEVQCEPAEAAKFVTDGYEDCSIDAFHFDAMSDHLFLVTSRWSDAGKSKFDLAEVEKFASGVQRFLGGDLRDFNSKFKAREHEVKEALYCERRVRITICIVHVGEQPLNQHAMRPLNELAADMNTPVEVCDVRQRSQAGVYEMITAQAGDPPISLQITLEDWGQITYPYQAYYGKVSADQVAAWYKDHKNDLFTKNLRLYYPNSVVNRSIRKTARSNPRDFWYFNNGLTIIADSVGKAPGGGTKNSFGIFNCQGASIVNGAQTVGAIGAELEEQSENADPAYVHARLISLEACPEGFASDITRATNLQNAVGTREFASMDPNQHRLALDFQLDGRRYAYRSGDSEPMPDVGCSLVEATQALGCRHSVGATVEVKREIGSIWADPKSSPYTDIFPQDLSATTLWRSVRIMRAVEERLSKYKRTSDEEPKKAMVATHLNRLILHLILNEKDISEWLADYGAPEGFPKDVGALTSGVFDKALNYIESKFPNAYLSSFSKNTEKCEALVTQIRGTDASGTTKKNRQGFLFKEMAKEVGADTGDTALDQAFDMIDPNKTSG
jgi:hypothetical protein